VVWLVPAGRAVGTVLRDPVVVILLLAGAAELLAGDPLVDGLVLLTVAAALARDRVRERPPGGVPTTAPGWADRLVRARPTPALVIGGLLYSVAAGGLARFSWPAMVAVAVPGVVGVASAWYAAPGPPAEAVTIAGYLLIVGYGVALELSSRRRGSPVPSFGALLSRVMRTRSGRVGVLVGWAWLGVHFLAR
jgi:hypothetical protein